MKLSLSKQIFIALFLFAMLFIGLLINNIQQSKLAVELQQSQGILNEVSLRSIDLANKASIYADVAPRDFPQYNRDVELFYPTLVDDLNNLDTTVNKLESLNTIIPGVGNLQSVHAKFKNEFWDALGDRNEPRLEWASDYLAENTVVLRDAATSLSDQVNQQTIDQLKKVDDLAKLSWLLALASIALILLWFWLRVSKRIHKAADSCHQVATGAFGTRIEDSSADEIGQFSSAFNSLSSRTRVVLGVLDQLPANANTAEAFTTLWNESHPFLKHQWQGIFAVSKNFDSARFITARQHSTNAFQFPNANFNSKALIEQLELEKNQHGFIANTRKNTLSNENGKLLRVLSRRGLTSTAFVLLKNESNDAAQIGREHLLLCFAWEKHEPEQNGVASFLGGLNRFLQNVLLNTKTA